MKKEYYVRLPLKNGYNIRDLGGYPTASGAVTKWRRFLRADDLCNLEQDDIDFLLDYGVDAVMDLRGADELRLHKSPFEHCAGVNYLNVPLMGGTITDVTKQAPASMEGLIPRFYMHLLQHSHGAIKRIFEFFAGCGEGCVIFHCAVGKDRTGVAAMLLLGLCGVNRFDIITNYETTYANLRNNAMLMANMKGQPREALFSRADYIEPAIDYVAESCGGFWEYLTSVGISEEDLKRVKGRLV